MPSYDFSCQDCGTAYEARLSMSAYSAGEGRVCPACGSARTTRTFSAVSVITGGRSGGDCPRDGGPKCSSGFT